MSVWEDIRIMWDANRTMVYLEQHTQPASTVAWQCFSYIHHRV